MERVPCKAAGGILETQLFRSPRTVLSARSIAIVGASERGRWPAQIIGNLKGHSYAGRIFLVNPRQSTVFGEPCYPSLRDLPEPPEHAAIIVPSSAVAGVLEDAASSGIISATVYAAGMGDGDGPESQQRGVWLKDFIARSGLRISGPNCMGSMSFRERLFCYPNGGLCELEPGPVSVIFQSGGNLQFFMAVAADRGLRFAYAVSTGNEPDLDLADYLNYVVDDEHTRTIVLFIEGIRRPEAFMAAAAKALERGKPILAIKTGRSLASQEAAKSHTGAIAGDYAAFLAMCDRYGIVTVRSMDDLVETALAFQCGRRPSGGKIGFVTTSGGTVDLLFDYMETENAELATYSDKTKAALLPTMQDGIAPKNPLDVGIPSTNEAAANWCQIVHDDPDVDIVAYSTTLPRKQAGYGDMTPFAQLMKTTTKPIIGIGRIVHSSTPEAVAQQKEAGFPFLMGLEPTVRAMKALWFHAERQGRAPLNLSPPKAGTITPATLAKALADYGIALPKSQLAASAAQAASAASAIGFPVALKIQSADILHKTEAGGVVLGLASATAVKSAAESLLAAAEKAYPNAQIDGFLVQEMVAGVEAIVGARRDALYGPMLLVGSGGILVELASDAALSMLPIDATGITRLVDRLKLTALLAGYRGKPPADRKALEHTVAALAQFFLDHRDRLADIEINPLMIRSDGQGAVAVDVRVIWR